MLAEVEAQATQGGGNKYRQVDWDVSVDQVLKEWHVESATLKEELQRLFEEGDDNNDGILRLNRRANAEALEFVSAWSILWLRPLHASGVGAPQGAGRGTWGNH